MSARETTLKLRQLLRFLAPGQALDLLRRRKRKWQRKKDAVDQKVLTFEPRPGVEVQGDVLVAYIVDAFLLKDGPEPVPIGKIPHSHTQWWESLQIVQTFLDLGYRVDAISWLNTEFRPSKPYKVALDVRILLQHWAPHLPADCIKILHAETAHCSYHNPAQHRRLDALEARRGRRLAPNKLIQDHKSLEVADCVTMLGEGDPFIRSTYEREDAPDRPLYPIPISTPRTWPEMPRDFASIQNRFVWFGSGGLVHKGLDRVLEAFAAMPDLHLTVCGPIRQERDFEREYWRELYETPNIHFHGWIDIASQEFVDLMTRHVGFVFASCSEAQCGGVLTCMHAGLIPIVSYQTGAPVTPERGIVLEDNEISTIQDSVRRISTLAPDELKAMSHATWSHVQARHTREVFAVEYRRAIEDILQRFSS